MKKIFLSFFVLMWAGVQAQTLKTPNIKVAAGATGFLYLDGANITMPEGIDIVYKYDPKTVAIGTPTLTGGVLEGKNYGIEANTAVAGEVRIAVLAKGALVSPTGNIVQIPYTAIGAAGAVSALTISSFKVNEVDFTANVTNGTFTIEGGVTPPTPTAGTIESLDNGNIQLQQNAYAYKDGTHYLVWSQGCFNPNAIYATHDGWVKLSKSKDGLNWTTENVLKTTYGTIYHNLEIDANGVLHILFNEGSNVQGYGLEDWSVQYANNKGGVWTKTEVAGINGANNYNYQYFRATDLAFDQYGKLHAYFNNGGWYAYTGVLYERVFDGTSWNTYSLVSNFDFGGLKGADDNENRLLKIEKNAAQNLVLYVSAGLDQACAGCAVTYHNKIFKFTQNGGTYTKEEILAARNYYKEGANVLTASTDGLTASYNGKTVAAYTTETIQELHLDQDGKGIVVITAAKSNGARKFYTYNTTDFKLQLSGGDHAIAGKGVYIYAQNIINPKYLKSVLIESPPFTLTTGGEGVHSIITPGNLDSDMNGLKLAAGDWIAVAAMDADGKPTVITDAQQFSGKDLSLKALGNNTDFSATKKGFAADEKFTFLVYQASSKLIFEVVAEFEAVNKTGTPSISHMGNFGGDGSTSKLKSLRTCKTQMIDLKKGWNFVAHWSMPYLKDLGITYQAAQNMIIKKADGNIALQTAGGTVISTSNLDSLAGYKVFVPADIKIEVCGKKILPQSLFNLKGSLTYPTFLPYLGENTTYIAVDLDALVVSKSFSVAQIIINTGVNAAGDPIYKAYDFIPGTSINEIDQILKGVAAGQAIKIKMIKDASFAYPDGVKRTKKTDYVKAGADAEHFKFEANVPDNMSVIVDLPQGAKIGDEIAAFIGGKLSGSVKIENEKTALIHVHSQENGKELSFKYFDSFTGKEKNFTASKTLLFRTDALATLTETVLGVSTVEMPIGTMIFPNPTSGLVKAYWPNASGETFEAVVYDALGKATSAVKSVAANRGQNEAVIDLEGFSKGVYVLKVSGQHSGAWTARIVKE